MTHRNRYEPKPRISILQPRLILKHEDFLNNVKIGIQTKGYEEFKGEKLLVCKAFLGKLMTTSQTNQKIKIDKVFEIIGSRGFRLFTYRV